MDLRFRLPSRAALLATALAAVVVAVAWPGAASSHNTFVSSDPAAGAVLETSPATITMVFGLDVPLDTATVTLIEPSGVRTELTGLTHGPGGATELIAPLPPLAPGEITVRWRLIGPDGHPLTDRISFTVAGLPAVSTAPATTAVGTGPVTEPTAAPPAVEVAAGAAEDESGGTSGAFRWLLRYGSYLAILAVVGIVLTDLLVWPGFAAGARVRRLTGRLLAGVAVLALVQLLVVAADVEGGSWWTSAGAVDAALRTHAGVAFLVRAVLAAAMWFVVVPMQLRQPEVRWTAIGVGGVGLMGTWAYAGHSRSLRWPELGVPLDIVHHTAAALWIGALAIVGLVASRRLGGEQLAPVVGRLSRVAAVTVGVIVATGAVQTVRLVGSPLDLLDADHGRFLAVKVVVLAVMLAAAAANRRRVHTGLGGRAGDAGEVARLRRAIAVEVAAGVLIVGITASMVVSPPASAAPGGRGPAPAAFSYPDPRPTS